MTVTPEMRDAGRLEFAKGNALDTIDGWFEPADIYLAMRALDPEVAELRKLVVEWETECREVEWDLRSANAFLASQGYTRGEDGTWEPGATVALAHYHGKQLELNRVAAALAALRAKYDAITRDAISGIETVPSVEHYYEGLLDKREAELAALHEFLRGQGYAKGEDGTWRRMG